MSKTATYRRHSTYEPVQSAKPAQSAVFATKMRQTFNSGPRGWSCGISPFRFLHGAVSALPWKSFHHCITETAIAPPPKPAWLRFLGKKFGEDATAPIFIGKFRRECARNWKEEVLKRFRRHPSARLSFGETWCSHFRDHSMCGALSVST